RELGVVRSMNRLFGQPGKRQPLSRASIARLIGAGMVRVFRPTLSGSGAGLWALGSGQRIGTTLASHARRLHVSAETPGPCSISQQPATLSRNVSAETWTTI